MDLERTSGRAAVVVPESGAADGFERMDGTAPCRSKLNQQLCDSESAEVLKLTLAHPSLGLG